MTNSFNITIDKYTLRSTDDYFVLAEIIRNDNDTTILQWYREEEGFTFKFLTDEPFAETEEEDRIFVNLFKILIDIINDFMLDEGLSMQFTNELFDEMPILASLLHQIGLQPLDENPEEENPEEGIDFKEPLDYNEDRDEYFYDDHDCYDNNDDNNDENYGYEDFED